MSTAVDGRMRVRVVIITAMDIELQRWTENMPLNDSLPFPEGAGPDRPPLRFSRALGVLGCTTGMGPTRAAVTLTALGHDGRLDLAAAYFFVAGIAG
eukprot:156303-Prymnesium_polylepis.1